MLSKKGKVMFAIACVVCAVGCIGMLYFGFVFFRDRKVVFWLYNAYMLGVTGIVVFMVHRYIKTYVN